MLQITDNTSEENSDNNTEDKTAQSLQSDQPTSSNNQSELFYTVFEIKNIQYYLQGGQKTWNLTI